MKILLDDGMQIPVGTGIGKYSLYLYRSLCENTAAQVDLVNYATARTGKKAKRLSYLRYINSRPFRKKCGQYDVVHFTNYAMPMKKCRGVKYVVTVHDLTSFLYKNTLSFAYGLYNRFVTKHAFKKADAIVTVSQSVKKDIEAYFPKYAHKVKVIYPGLYHEIARREYAEGDNAYRNERLNGNVEAGKFFLFVGTVERRKNIGFLLEAFHRFKRECAAAKDYKLVLAGREGLGYDEFAETVHRYGMEKDVIFTGYIDGEDCNKLYNTAKAYLFATTYEGFGSTQLECMACGLRLILSDIPTNREISGEYGLFFDLKDAGSLTERLCEVAEGRCEEVKDCGAFLENFNWNAIAKEYEEFYEALAGNDG